MSELSMPFLSVLAITASSPQGSPPTAVALHEDWEAYLLATLCPFDLFPPFSLLLWQICGQSLSDGQLTLVAVGGWGWGGG